MSMSLENALADSQAVCVTACGNFGLAGSSTGEIRMWNMQSGKERRSFSLTGPPPGDSKPKIIAAANGKGKAKAKKLLAEKSIQAITGLATDTLNNVVVASTLEGKLYVSQCCLETREVELICSSSISTRQKCWLFCHLIRRLPHWNYIGIVVS
jgi:U3 small nucleolar RNA-associated protein 21